MNAFSPDAIRAGTITITGHGGDEVEDYLATPLAGGSRGAIVWIHHTPGHDRGTREFARRLAVNGYHVVAPNLYSRYSRDAPRRARWRWPRPSIRRSAMRRPTWPPRTSR